MYSGRKYRLCVFAYLDIIGFKSIISAIGDDNEKAIEFINKLKNLMDGCEKTITIYKELGCQYQIFSDSICVWCYIDEDEHFTDKYSREYFEKCYTAVAGITMIVASIQRQGVLFYDLLFRGGISIGYHYHEGNVTLSQALVKAYIAESSLSVFPRVILLMFDDRCILTGLADSLASSGFVTIDDCIYNNGAESDIAFVDYCGSAYGCFLFDEQTISSFLDKHKTLITKSLIESAKDKKVLLKYVWLACYHNSKIRSGYEKYLIDLSEYEQYYDDIERLIYDTDYKII